MFILLLPGLASAQATGTPAQPGELPDTVSAPPFTVADKFDYRVVQAFGAHDFVGAAIGAAIGQANDTPGSWGQGAGGFAKRYVSGFAGGVSRQVFEFGLETAFHEDPRYFPSEHGATIKARLVNALKQVVFTRTDNGGDSFAYARVMSDFGNAQFVNLWQPSSNNSVGNGVMRGVIGLGADFGYNLLQEFVPFTRPISLRHRK